MQSIAQVQNVQKINAVSTGKVVNEKSMMVWRPPSTPTTTTTDTGSCGSCRCTVATTPTKSSKKSRRASRRSRTATSDAPASTTSSKCNVLASCATDRSWTRCKVVPDKSLTDKSKYA